MSGFSGVLIAAIAVLSFPVVLSCEECEEVTIFDNVTKTSKLPVKKLGLTLPGTKWCGPGDTAINKSDIGSLKKEDKCCREHDNCDDYLAAGEKKHGLENSDLFTRLHCKCENKFYNCLREANTFTASAIGNTYTIARQYCFDYQYPIKDCIEHHGALMAKRCIKYKLDKSKPKQWQWFDIPFYFAYSLDGSQL